MLYGLAVHVYFVVRFDGRWVDSDTADLVRLSDVIWLTGELPPPFTIFSSSLGFPLLEGFYARALGFTTADFALLVHPVLGSAFIVASWLIARRLFRDPVHQAIAIFILASGPDMLFETARGSHGAIAQSATLLALVATLALATGRENQGAWTVISILALGAIGIFNLKRGFIVASALVGAASGVILFARSRRVQSRGQHSRMLWVIAATGLLAVLFLNVASNGDIGHVVSRQINILSGNAVRPIEPAPSGAAENPSSLTSYMISTWGSVWRYAAFSLWTLIIPLAALVVWMATAVRIVRRSAEPPTLAAIFLWGAVTVLGVWLFVVVAGSFLGRVDPIYPLRVFVYATMIAALLVVSGIEVHGPRMRKKSWRLVALGLAVLFAIAAPLKATNEPAVNHHWRFFTEGEQQALEWKAEFHPTSPMWIGPDAPIWENRLATVYKMYAPFNWPYEIDTSAAPESFLVSPTVRAHASVRNVEIPSVANYATVYDNGDAEIYVRS